MDAPQIDEASIREAAYFLWLDAGRPDGRAEEYWHAARNALVAKTAAPRRRRAAAKSAAKPAVANSKARRSPARTRTAKASAKKG